MKLWLSTLLLIAAGAANLRAQPGSPPARLAIVVEQAPAAIAGDVLTVELSKRKDLQLLERSEIERVYREQALSAANKDYLKLGQVLGADGLLLLGTETTGTNHDFNIRLVAVRPGVVLTAEKFPVTSELQEWAAAFGKHLEVFFPKLTVLIHDAIPVSVVNLRSAVQSPAAPETERQLKLLTIQRLSQERQLFVLERQRLQMAAEEKELSANDSAFWNGSYLLEGVVDQEGYSRETITIHARLSPPKGAPPLRIMVSGSRTNLPETINLLAAKVVEALKINSSVKEWKASDEAGQYFDEAKWALKWRLVREAQMAADTAWALGKQDLDCALARVSAYASEVPIIQNTGFQHYLNGRKDPRYLDIDKPPNPEHIDVALRALEIYLEFSRSSPDGQAKVVSRSGSLNTRSSDWYAVGIEALSAAAQVLIHYHFHTSLQPAVSGRLADLRALSRTVSAVISDSPSVHDSYFTVDRVVTHDEWRRTLLDSPNIFNLKAAWGCLWQDQPDDGIALYRELMSSPAFGYLHKTFWTVENTPRVRLVAWNDADRRRIPALWNNFSRELSASTNFLARLEGMSLGLVYATNAVEANKCFTALFDSILEHREFFLTNSFPIIDSGYFGTGLISQMGGGIRGDQTEQNLWRRYNSDYQRKIQDLAMEYARHGQNRQQAERNRDNATDFERQKQFLKDNTPYDPRGFNNAFRYMTYTPAEAAELRPLLIAYKSNLVEKLKGATGPGAQSPVFVVDTKISWVESRLTAPSALPTNAVVVPYSNRERAYAGQTEAPQPGDLAATNIWLIKRFLPIPLNDLAGPDSSAAITAHHWAEGKLVLDLEYQSTYRSITTRRGLPAIAILDPVHGSWDVISCPPPEVPIPLNSSYRTVLLQGELFTSDGGQVRKFDFTNQRWSALEIGGGANLQLFEVGGRLYAANQDTILELVDGGKTTRVMASTRRFPAMSALDSLRNLHVPVLFEGTNHTLRASVLNKIYSWMDNDWREDSTVPAVISPEVFEEGVWYRISDSIQTIAALFRWPKDASAPELCLLEAVRTPSSAGMMGNLASARPLWRNPTGLPLRKLAVAPHQSDLYLLTDHFEQHQITNQNGFNTPLYAKAAVRTEIIERDGYHVDLWRLSREASSVQRLLLKFNDPRGCPPIGAAALGSDNQDSPLSRAWMLFADDFVFFGRDGYATGYEAGVWTVPLSELKSEIDRQSHVELTQKTQFRAAVLASAKQLQNMILTKYDRNHNGVIDPKEKESALEDPAFIASEMERLDANQNGFLDARELAWFDVNTNRLLEPIEESAITNAHKVFAKNMFVALDSNHDGYIDPSELVVFRNGFATIDLSANSFYQFFPDNRDKKYNAREFEAGFIRLAQNRFSPLPPASFSPYPSATPIPFRQSVEMYWSGLNPEMDPLATPVARGPIMNRVPSNRPAMRQ